MRLRKIEAFTVNKAQAERQSPKKGLPKIVKFVFFIIFLATPFVVWRFLTLDTLFVNGVVMGPMQLEMENMDLSSITSPIDGKISQLYAETGARVEEGSTIALIKASDEAGGLSKDIRASYEMVIVKKNKSVGDIVNKGDVIYSVTKPKRYWIDAFVPARFINNVRVGQEAEVWSSIKDKKIKGKIEFVYAEIDQMPKMFSRYYYLPEKVFKVRIFPLDASDDFNKYFKFGMSVHCKIFK